MITATRFVGDLPGWMRCLVAHPGSPPRPIRLVEIVPAPFTAPTVAERAASLFASVGLAPVTVGRFETTDLNTRRSIAAHTERLGPSCARMGAERSPHDPSTPDLVVHVERERRAIVPLEEIGMPMSYQPS